MSLEYVEEHMVNFINDINYEREMQLEDICEFHCRFEKIHPFLDGNGRIGRLIMLRQCLQNNITPFIIDNDTRGEYINALKMYHKTKFASFLVEYCKKLQKIFSQKYYAKFNQKKNDRVSTIVNFIKENGFISRKDVEKLFSIKSTAAKSILNQLINKRILVSLNEGKLSIYKLR
jgi:Fic family protein